MPISYGGGDPFGQQSFLSSAQFNPGLLQTLGQAFLPMLGGQFRQEAPLGMSQSAFTQLQQLSSNRLRDMQSSLAMNPYAIGSMQRFLQKSFQMSQSQARNLLIQDGTPTALGQAASTMANAMLPFFGDPAGKALVRAEIAPFFSGAKFGGLTGGIRGVGAGLREAEVSSMRDFFMPTVSGRFQGGGVQSRFDIRTAFDVTRMGVSGGLLSGLSRGGGTETEQSKRLLEGMQSRIKDFVEIMDLGSGLMETFTKEETFGRLMQLTQGNVALTQRGRIEQVLRDVKALADMADVSVEAMSESVSRGVTLGKELGLKGVSAVSFGQQQALTRAYLTPVAGKGFLDPEEVASVGGVGAVEAGLQEISVRQIQDQRARVSGMALRGLREGRFTEEDLGLSKEQLRTLDFSGSEFATMGAVVRKSFGTKGFITGISIGGVGAEEFVQARAELSESQQIRETLQASLKNMTNKAELFKLSKEDQLVELETYYMGERIDPRNRRALALSAQSVLFPTEEIQAEAVARDREIQINRAREQIADRQRIVQTPLEGLVELARQKGGDISFGDVLDSLSKTVLGKDDAALSDTVQGLLSKAGSDVTEKQLDAASSLVSSMRGPGLAAALLGETSVSQIAKLLGVSTEEAARITSAGMRNEDISQEHKAVLTSLFGGIAPSEYASNRAKLALREDKEMKSKEAWQRSSLLRAEADILGEVFSEEAVRLSDPELEDMRGKFGLTGLPEEEAQSRLGELAESLRTGGIIGKRDADGTIRDPGLMDKLVEMKLISREDTSAPGVSQMMASAVRDLVGKEEFSAITKEGGVSGSDVAIVKAFNEMSEREKQKQDEFNSKFSWLRQILESIASALGVNNNKPNEKKDPTANSGQVRTGAETNEAYYLS